MDSLEIIADSSQLYITWALALLGGSIATIIGTSHISPAHKATRCIYLLFIPAWASLSASISFGDLVSRNYLASIVSVSPIEEILRDMNSNLINQQFWMLVSVLFMSSWLCLYVLWWIWGRPTDSEEK